MIIIITIIYSAKIGEYIKFIQRSIGNPLHSDTALTMCWVKSTRLCQSDLDQTATRVGLVEWATLEEAQVYPNVAESKSASQIWSREPDLIMRSNRVCCVPSLITWSHTRVWREYSQLNNRVWVTQVRKGLDSTHHSLTLWFSSNIFNDRLEFPHRRRVRERQHDIEMLEPDAASNWLSHGCYQLYSKWSSLCFFNNFRHPELNFITNTKMFRHCP